jgi:hypothetical protein
VLRADGELKVTPVVSGGRVLTTFSAPAAWTADARELVRGGVELTFSFDVELRRPSMLMDSTLARVRMTSSVKYDTLTGNFQVSKRRDGKLLESNRSEQEPEVREWMIGFQQVLLEPLEPLESNAEYYVRVRLYASPRRNVSLWTLWPFGRDDGSGRTAFTFIR